MLPLIYLFILGASWGLHVSIIKVAAESGLSYLGIATLTTAGVALGFVLIAGIRRRRPVFDRQHLRFYFICAMLGYVVPFYFELASAVNLPASVLTLIISSAPLFTIVIALLVRSDTVSARRLVAVAVGATASALILVPSVLGASGLSIAWVLVAFIAPLAYSMYHNYVAKAWPKNSDSFQVACGEALVALAVLAPIYIFSGAIGDLQGPYGIGHVTIAVMAIFSVVEIFLYFETVRLAGPIFTSQANFVTVITGVLWAMLIFGEKPGRGLWLSTALLTVALFLLSKERVSESSASP